MKSMIAEEKKVKRGTEGGAVLSPFFMMADEEDGAGWGGGSGEDAGVKATDGEATVDEEEDNDPDIDDDYDDIADL